MQAILDGRLVNVQVRDMRRQECLGGEVAHQRIFSALAWINHWRHAWAGGRRGGRESVQAGWVHGVALRAYPQ